VSGTTLTFQEETMTRLLTGILLLAAAGTIATGQSNLATGSDQAASSTPNAYSRPAADSRLDKPELMRLIAQYEAGVRNAEATHADHAHLALMYEDLANLYEEAALGLKAEDAMKRALVFLKEGPQTELANEFAQLATLYVAMNNMRAAEKNEMQHLRLRESIGDPVGVALAWNDLAGINNDERKFKDAAAYAQKAYPVLAGSTAVSLDVRVAVRQELGYALTGIRECTRGIPILQDAAELARSAFGPKDLRTGYAEYILGFGYWHCSDRQNAGVWLERGTTLLKADYGWDQAIYVNAMRQYARFLRESGQRAAAVSAEAVVHQSEAAVDAQSLAGRSDAFRSAGSK
jgi:hypothetical protein